MIADPKDSPGFHHEIEESCEVMRTTISNFNAAATKTQRGALKLQHVTNAAQHDARQVRTATAERKRARQSSYPPSTAIPAVASSKTDPKIRCD